MAFSPRCIHSHLRTKPEGQCHPHFYFSLYPLFTARYQGPLCDCKCHHLVTLMGVVGTMVLNL